MILDIKGQFVCIEYIGIDYIGIEGQISST